MPSQETSDLPLSAFAPYSTEERVKMIDVIGTNTIRLAGLVGAAALTEADPEKYVTIGQINSYLDTFQDEPSDQVENYLDQKYRERILDPLDLVISSPSARHNAPRSKAFRLSTKGDSIGLATAGSLLDMELSAPEDGFLRTIFGYGRRHANHNPYRKLISRLVKGPASPMELARSVPLPRAKVDMLFQELSPCGVLCDLHSSKASVYDKAANSLFQLPNSTHWPLTNASPELQAALAAAKALRLQTISVTGIRILALATQRNPRVAPERIWEHFRRYVDASTSQEYPEAIIDLLPKPRSNRQPRYAITAEYLPRVQKLVQTLDWLSGTGPDNLAFQKECREKALAIASSRTAMSRLVSSSSHYRPSKPADWLPALKDLVPERGIAARTLYRQVVEQTGKNINFQMFVRHLRASTLEGYTIETIPERKLREKGGNTLIVFLSEKETST